MQVNTKEWNVFRIDEAFTVKGGYYNKKPEHSLSGNIPFLGATDSNNGATDYYSIEDIKGWDKVGLPSDSIDNKIFRAPAIAVTVNGSVCNAYYQNKDFTCSHDISVLYPKDGHSISRLEALFCCTVIQMEKYRWSYGRKLHDINKLSAMTIKLPATDAKEVDWAYMEQYMNSLHNKPLMTQRDKSTVVLNEREWAEFKLREIATIRNGKGITREEIEEHKGALPAIQSGEDNQGVLGYIDKQYCLSKGYAISASPALSVARSGTAGFVVYHNEPFVVGDSAKIIEINDMSARNPYTYLFLETILNKNRYKYSYGRKVTESGYYDTIIELPINKDGNPDWKWIVKYIKSLPMAEHIPDLGGYVHEEGKYEYHVEELPYVAEEFVDYM